MGAILCVLGGAVLFAIVLALWFMGAYNGLVGGRNQVKEGWAQIDVQLKRRYDLIPNLMETVKGYVKHEKELLESIAKARSGLMGGSPAQSATADAALSTGLRQLWAVSENYPELKANESFGKMHEELVQTENKIAFARQHYNEVVLRYNDRTMMIPGNMVAGMFNFKPEQFFEVESAEERKNVQVKF